MSKPKEICKNCRHWHNGQERLNYYEGNGFCLNPAMDFSVDYGRIVGVLDFKNHKDVPGNPSHDTGSLERHGAGVIKSQYHLVTDESFGCNCFEKAE